MQAARDAGLSLGLISIVFFSALRDLMPRFHHGPVEIAYLDQGEGEPIILVHGFASNKEVNWVQPGWMSPLTRAGRRVIALDNRGHGQSTKLYSPDDYHTLLMAQDVLALIDHLGLPRADIMGYSMGARICAFLALHQPGRVRTAILGGLGIRLVDGDSLPENTIAAALEAPSLDQVTDPVGRMFRSFAEQTKSDLRALAACIRGSRQTLTRSEVQSIRLPVLVAVGSKDAVAGSAAELAALLPDGQALDITGRDHMLAVGDKVFKAGVLDFLARHG
jgi:pimeloyl-ACP methyl ester carboxylesterase